MAAFCLLTGYTKDQYLRLSAMERAAFQRVAKRRRK